MNQHHLDKCISVHMELVLRDEIEFRLHTKAPETSNLVSIMHLETSSRTAE